MGYRAEKTAHIFPTQVSAVGWDNPEHVLHQDLSAQAPHAMFSIENSASISLAAVPRAPEPEPVVEMATSTSESADETLTASSTDSQSDPPIDEEANVPNPPPEEIPTQEPFVSTPATTTDVEEGVLETSPLQIEPSEELPADGATSTPEARVPSYFSLFASSAFAQSTEDIAECVVLAVPCHTIEVSGFTLEGTLSEKRLDAVELNFSFASAEPIEALEDDMLIVRYFHEGAWRVAGELFLNKEMSNGANGGYFTAVLDDVEEWEDLEEIRVVVEFSDAELESPAEVFLDAVWIDTVFKDRAQDILNGDTYEPYAGSNVGYRLAGGEETDPSTLHLGDGTTIVFPYTDDFGDDLSIRVDKKSFAARAASSTESFESTAIISVTNTESTADVFRLLGAFDNSTTRVRSIEQFLHNVPRTTSHPLYDDVTYRCESGWSSDGRIERCGDTDEAYACAQMSDENRNCLVEDVEVGTEDILNYESTWVKTEIGAEGTNGIVPEGYRATSATALLSILPGQTLYFRVVFESEDVEVLRFLLLAEGESFRGDLDSRFLKSDAELADDAASARAEIINELLSDRSNFDASEMPRFTFKYHTQRSIFARFFNRVVGRDIGFIVEGARITDEGGMTEDVPFKATVGEDGEWDLELRERPRKFRPGKYALEVSIREGSETYVDSAEFNWGVLAINSNKSIYAPGEEAQFFLAALDESGDTLCDAILELAITDPSGKTRAVPVQQSGDCGPNNVIESADYLANYAVGAEGEYRVALIHVADDGSVENAIVDSFEVREFVPFTIERRGATRIWPVADYRMTLTLTATADFSGEFIEAIPQDFIVVDAGGAESEIFGGAKRLIWPVNLKAGESIEVSYVYDAPDISPYLYLVGPAEVRQGDALPFSESRQWKIASDAVGNLLVYWDGSYIPSGWTCVSCAGGDAFFQRFIIGSTTPSTNGGAATHTHTATGAVAATASAGDSDSAGGGVDVALNTHTHTYTPTISGPSNLPPYRNLVILQANTTGEVQIPTGAIALFDVASSSLPSGWFRYAAQDGRFIRGEATANIGTTGGASTHSHTITGTTGASGTNTNASGAGVNIAANTHTHTVSSSTSVVNNEPPYREVLLARITATSTAPNGMIGMWTGDTFTGWDIISGSGGAFENRFAKASTTYGGTGGSATHTHTDVTGITSSVPSASVSRTTTGTSDAISTHTHSVNVTSFSTTDHQPPYRTAVFAKRLGGQTPTAPTSHVLFESEQTGTSTPSLEFTSSDPDGTDTLTYQIQWDDDADLDVSPIGDRSSSSESGCSPDCFQNTVSGGDISPFNEAERIRFTIQTALVSGTTYYWRVRAQDTGSSWGSWSTTTSFTYVANTNPSQWFQTEDAQFETGTLSDTETTGSDSVRILAADPVEALVAYGEGVVQTPRYQVWDGSAWGGELSAQSVGGTIQWVLTKAAPTRDEYILGTQDAGADVNVQVYDGVADTWGDLVEATAALDDITARGFDIAYETQSGDAIVVYCDGDGDPSYRVWDGSSWVGPTTITLTLANDCEYIKLASDPQSDEIILVARDTAASATDYEAMVWDGTAWGNSLTLGAMTDTLNEGIAVEYEESGNQAIVATSNGDTNGFIWAAWDGLEWTVPTAQALQDDFEWGIMKRDVGSDSMALCYADQDDDLGVERWDGSAWAAFQEFDTAGNTAADATIDGRPVSCEFEITSGRDGYLMVPYSDGGAVQYQFMDDATGFSGEAALATINDSWTVGSARTGDGTILMVAWDDANTQYDFSFWNGSVWNADSTLEGSPSVTAEPFREPVHMAAQIYQPAEGTITSDPISFSLVSGQPSWGEASWDTTEPSGTDVILQVRYGASCAALVPDIALPGNSTGFQAAASPLDLSGVSTTTYSQLCLEATLSSASQNNPTLDEWGISWERQPYLTQTQFQWYANLASSLTPTDVWPSGATDLNENDAISASYAPISGATLRLRMSVLTENVSLAAGSLTLKMQYAVGSSCSSDSQWFDVGAVGSSTAAWRGADNALLTDGATLPSTLLTGSDVNGTYEEQNDSAVNPSLAAANAETEWDFVLQHNALPGTNYCFRAVSADGLPLDEYDRYPALVTNQKPSTLSLEKPFDNEQVASTTPWFEFAGEDPESNDITYQIHIDDDTTFASPVIDRNSQDHLDDFSNLVTPADRDPFTTGQTVRFTPPSALTSGTTYYWRVRGKDRNASNAWSDWSEVQSVTVQSGTAITTWFQTTEEQFDTNTHEDTEAAPADDVILSTGLTIGTTTSTSIDFDSKTTGNAWGSFSWNDTEASSDIKYHIEYLDGSTWELIPESDLAGNASGFDTSPVSLLGVDTLTYNEIRIRANLTDAGASPHLLDWKIEWGFAVSQPTIRSLFNNEKTGTTTPSFTFFSTDPESNDLVYQISWSTTPDFAASTTRESSLHAGFVNSASSTDTSPFISGNLVRYDVQTGDALTNGTTYWWRARARDSAGANVWSVWSPLQSHTVNTSVSVSTWFQTTDEQFDTNELNNIETTGSDAARITATIREAFAAYAEGTAQVPRYRIWNGATWGLEGSAQSIGDSIRFVEAAAAPTRDEYVVATMGSTGVVDAQLYNGTSTSWGNMTEIVAAVSDASQRGYDIAYETDSGDALAVACSATEATYKTWNGSTWSASNPITLGVSGNCEWVKLASDPLSDEIIAVFRDATTGAIDYQAQVWNGSSWGNATTTGSQVAANNEGIALGYEESGNQAIVAVANGANNNFVWISWNGSSWSSGGTVAIGNDFANGRFCSDVGSDVMAMSYIDIDNDIGVVRWNGSSFSGFQEFDTGGNSQNGRPISCEFETNGGRDGYIMIPYSDTTDARYQFWNGSILSGESTLTTITDAWEVRTARTGDGTILAFAYDDANTEYDVTSWNGSTWSTEQVLEATSITTLTPATVPIDIVARLYPTFTTGSLVSTSIDFDDGLGLKWDEVFWSDTTPGSSDILLQVQYATGTDWALVPDSVIPGNAAGIGSTPIDLANVNYQTYNTLRLVANFECIAGDCPTLQDWSLAWSPGLEISGTAKAYDQSTNITSGTVGVAVNGVVQVGKTGSISGGSWTISNVTVFSGDVVSVFIVGASDANEAIAVTKYDGTGDIDGIELFERHLSIGSSDNQTIANADLALYDNSVAGDDLFHDVDAGNDFTVCATTGCSDAEVWIKSGNTYRPDSTSSGNVSTHDIEINGTLVADGNTITVSGSWDNNSIFTPNTSTLVFSATSSTETIDSTGASGAAYNNVTFGTSGSATWNLSTALDVNGNLAVNFGTLAKGSQSVTIAGNLAIGASGLWSKGTATTTFDGSTLATWSDATASKQDLGKVAIDGSAKTVQLASSVKTSDLTIGADDTFDVSGSSYGIEILSNWTNNNSFTAHNGLVTFSATTTGKTIVAGNSSFYNILFSGSGGNWAFAGGTVSASNNFSISAGILTLPTGTTTIGGNFTVSGGSFMHNNGVVLFNGSSAKTIQPLSNSFYDLSFNGTGSWTFPDGFATSSRHTIITSGTLTLPTTLAVGGSFLKNGGSFVHNSGTLRFTGASAQSIRLNASDAYNLTFAGSGSWSFLDTNATTTSTVRIESGAVTLPSGIFAIGGSWLGTGGSFTHNSGTVKFNSSDTGESVAPNGSWFGTLLFDSSGGGWTITENATSSSATSISNASSFTLSSGRTLAVGGTFTNSVGGAASTWTGSTLYLYSGSSHSINSKSGSGDAYGTLMLAANTDVRLWNSAASTTNVHANASVFSQDHDGQDGDLYIWGEYVSSGNEYWSYATDFDGTALGGSSRQVDVRVASGASILHTSSTFQMLGGSLATTTIANQGSGTYSMHISGGSLQAQYYSIRNTDANGLYLSGTPSILSLANGDFELGINGGSMMSLAASVIDQNPALQIQRVSFATSSGISSGYNVSATSSASSYWWFRNHYGAYASESFDNDTGGNPGYVRFDDSGFSVTISGTVYSARGVTELSSPTCDDTTPVLRVVVNGGTSFTGPCDSSDGSYSIPNVQFTGDSTLAVYLDGVSERAVTVTRTVTDSVSDLDLYVRTLIVRHESTEPLTIENLAHYDNADDADLFFTAATSSAALSVLPGYELHVWNGATFAPGGDVTTQGGGSGDSRDGRLHLAPNATITAVGSEAYSIGGDFVTESGALFSAASSTLTFTATTSQSIALATPLTLYNLDFNGAGGNWNLSGATTTVQNTASVNAGTLAGTSSLVVESGTMTGSGAVAMTGGTVYLTGTGAFGGTTPWQLFNLTIGDASSVRTTTKAGTGTSTVLGVFTIRSNHTFNAGSSTLVFAGSGTPFVASGNFVVQSAPVWYTATGTTNIADETYGALVLVPASGSPTYAFQGGVFSIDDLTIGGATPVTVSANTNDPSITITDDVIVTSGSTFIASNVGALEIAGSWNNGGTFTHSNGEIVFDSTDSGEVVQAGTSSFYDVEFDGTGGWTVQGNATSSRNFALLNAGGFTLASGSTLAVSGTFTNNVGGSATDWTGSTLALTSGSAFAINAKTGAGDTYGTVTIGSSTDVRMWHSSAVTTVVESTSSLYSQDHGAVDGDLYIWGEYLRTSGSDYWSAATDFDGTSIASTSRQVDVRIAPSASVTLSGGLLDILGAAGATTSIQVQGSGSYAFDVTGGTLNADYFEFRNLDADGLMLTGSPTISSLSRGDFELAVDGGSSITVAGSVIDANPLKVILSNRFATSSGVASGFNVEATGTSNSSWKFNLHYGPFDGEVYDSDPAGDPGLVRWDDSASQITIAGNVYSDEGSSVSSVCDGSTPVVRLLVQGVSAGTSDCDTLTGEYSVSNISYNPGDTLVAYLDGASASAVNVSVDPNTNIANMHLYERRVIVRHEDTTPLTIADMAIYDRDQDSDIPFDAEDAATDTLTLPPETKLIVWNSKTFAPAGDITLQSGGSGAAWDGTLEMFSGAVFSAAGTQTHSIGGSLLIGSGASMVSGQSTFVMTATTTGKTIQPGSSSFYNLTFNGSSGNWAFAGPATTTNNLTVTLGTVTLPSTALAIGGAFEATGGTFMHNNGTITFTSTATGKNVRASGSPFYNMTFNGTGGGWTFMDTNATSSSNVVMSAGAVTLPSGTLAVGSSFTATSTGTFTHNSGTVRMTASSAGKTLHGAASSFNHVTFAGSGGEWIWGDAASTANNVTITAGSTTLPVALTLGGSFENTGGSFYHNNGAITFTASATGKNIRANGSWFGTLVFNGASGGWTMLDSATSTGAFSLNAASTFTLSPGATLTVNSVFTNAVGSVTSWTGSTLKLSGASSTINTKAQPGDTYNTLVIGAATDVRMWNSSAGTTTVDSTGSLYSQDHAAVDGDLYIWGEYEQTSGTERWSYSTDFDGTSLGSPRRANVRIASSSIITLSGGTLEMLGSIASTTSVSVQGSGAYSFDISGGTVNANYYAFRNLDSDGLNLSGSPALTSLDNGSFELAQSGGTMMTVAASVIDANASKQITNVTFATSSGVTSGYNVVRTGSPVSAWNFDTHGGNYDGEAFDQDGGDACGSIRWDDSACLFVSQEHYRWRNDNGGEGAPDTEWFNASWSKRKKLTVQNPTSEALTNFEAKVVVEYDGDMQSDFDDLRFTDASGTTSIDYWVESASASASSTVWLEIPAVPDEEAAVVYMYYGNASVLSTSDGEAVFDFFDDFEDDDISEYSGNTTLFNTGETFNYTGVYGLDAFGDEDQKTTGGIYRTGSLSSRDTTIRYFQYIDVSAGSEDAPCALFGVQASGQNYAVCLNLFGTDKVFISEDVISNEAESSGTVLASTTVSFDDSGWYQVEVDWLDSGSITATVYHPNGSVFASVNHTDSTYSSGGVGFTYWGQHGGWDFYSVRQYTTSDASYVFSLEQTAGGASWRATEDTYTSIADVEQNLRLRFSVQNSGSDIDDATYRLQVAPKGASLSCEAVTYGSYADVPLSDSCGSAAACMAPSSNFTDLAPTTELLASPASLTFVAGSLVEDLSNQSSALDIGANRLTEVEYNFQMTQSAVASAYCFRVADAADSLDNYERVAELRLVHPPFITNWALNAGSSILLTEGATTTVSATGTITDFNGYADILNASSTIYRSGAGATCSQNDNSCYQVASCSLSSCAGNSCTLSCSAPLQYHADPTDSGSYAAETWLARVQVVDSNSLLDTETSLGVELLSLFGLTVNSDISYGTLTVGESSTTTAQTTVRNTGNSNIDLQLEGTAIGGIPVNEQQFATSTFVYASCSICQFLTGAGSPTNLEADLPKPTATSTPITDDVYWGINVPTGTAAGSFQGTNTFWATSD